MGSESDVATDWKTDLIIGKNFNRTTQNAEPYAISYPRWKIQTIKMSWYR